MSLGARHLHVEEVLHFTASITSRKVITTPGTGHVTMAMPFATYCFWRHNTYQVLERMVTLKITVLCYITVLLSKTET